MKKRLLSILLVMVLFVLPVMQNVVTMGSNMASFTTSALADEVINEEALEPEITPEPKDEPTATPEPPVVTPAPVVETPAPTATPEPVVATAEPTATAEPVAPTAEPTATAEPAAPTTAPDAVVATPEPDDTVDATATPEASEEPAVDTSRNATFSVNFAEGWVEIAKNAVLKDNTAPDDLTTQSKGIGYALSRENNGQSNDRLLVAYAADSEVRTAYIAARDVRPMSADEIAAHLSKYAGAKDALLYKGNASIPLMPLALNEKAEAGAENVPADPPTEPEKIEALSASLYNPNRTMSAGYETEWTVSAQGGVAPYSYTFSLLTDGKTYKEFAVRNTPTFIWNFKEAGIYTVSVTVTDAEGNKALANSNPIKISAPATVNVSASSIDLKNIAGIDTWQGGGIIAQGYYGDASGKTMANATLDQLKAAYVKIDTPYLTVGSPSKWTTVTAGGNGVYYYQYAIYKATYALNDWVQGTREYLSTVSKTSSLSYTVKSAATPALYFLDVLLVDEARQYYVVIQSPTYTVTTAAASDKPTTVTGKVKQIVAQEITAGMSQTEKARALHDWLLKNAIYDHSYTNYHADGVLLMGIGVCNSFAEAYMMLCKQAGLECIVVQSTRMNHAWNAVMIDGQWYHVDVTWDNRDDYTLHYEYFLKKDSQIPDHYGYSKTDFENYAILPTGSSPVVDTLKFSPASVSIPVGSSKVLTTAYYPVNAAKPTLTWSSADTTIATVSASGNVIGKKAGTVTITAKTQYGVKATCKVTVCPPVSSVKLNKTSAPLHIGKTLTLTAAVAPTNAANKSVTWQSSNTAVATVTAKGVVKGIKAGTVKITATTVEGSKIATCTVRVGLPVTGVTLDKASSPLYIGSSLTLKPTVTPGTAANKTVTWTTSNKAVATVTSAGVVKGIKAGTVKITATTSEGKFAASCTVRVGPRVTSVKLNKTSAPLHIGKTLTLTATVAPSTAANKTVTWKSSNTTVATVSATGVVKGIKAGSAKITATTKDGAKIAACTVKVGLPVTGVTLNKASSPLFIGSSLTLVPTVAPGTAANKAVTWTTSNKAVATVTSAGVVKGIKAGTVKITATTSEGKFAASCTVRVGPRVTSVKLNKTTATLFSGKTLALTATVAPSTAANKTVTWKSSNTAVATVSTAGVVKGIKAGTVKITATTKDGAKVATCSITVRQSATGVKLNTAFAPLHIGKTLTLAPTFIPSNTYNKAVTWQSSNTAIATVSAAGVVKGVATGTAEITVKTADGGFTAQCTIKVGPAVIGMELNNPPASMSVGQTFALLPVITPADAANMTVVFTSSAPNVATVSNAGLVEALSAGSTVITATTQDGGFVCSYTLTVQ